MAIHGLLLGNDGDCDMMVTYNYSSKMLLWKHQDWWLSVADGKGPLASSTSVLWMSALRLDLVFSDTFRE